MRPWQHSASSLAKRAARANPVDEHADLELFLALHEFLDLSKTGCADRRHRIMLHHCDLGATIAQRAFPHLEGCSQLVRQHVEEDLGFEALLDDWLAGLDFSRLPKPVAQRIDHGHAGVAQMVINRLVGARATDAEARQFQEDAAREVAQFLWQPFEIARSAPASVLSLLMNSVGPSLVRGVFGPPEIRFFGGRQVVVDWGWLAEAVTMASFGRIPDYAEVVRCVGAEPKRMAKAS